MTNIALLFPGQGAQQVGMGKELYELSSDAKAVFDQAQAMIGPDFLKVVFEGPAETLMLTAYSQPAIMTMSMAGLAAFKAHPKFANVTPKFAAGLSLGEYSALCASGAMSFEATLNLLKKRAEFMEEAAKSAQGAMAAIIGLEKEVVTVACQKAGAEVANFNTPQQTVITGHADKVKQACALLTAAGAKNVVPLDVSGAFHSSLMKPAEEKFSHTLAAAEFEDPQIPIVHNVDGQPNSDAGLMKQKLSSQITSSVQWVATMQFLESQGISEFVEIGPGNVLKGLARRISRDLKVHNIQAPTDIEKLPF